MPRDVYTADMGQPPSNDDMGSIQNLRRRLTGAAGMDKVAPMAPMGRSPVTPNPADAGIYTADKGMPPSPDDMGSIQSMAPKTPRQVKARKDLRAAMGMKKGGYTSGGKVSSASKRADGIAVKGKTKGKFC